MRRKNKLKRGDVVADYRVERLLGAGSSGEVWVAKREPEGDAVALKIMHNRATEAARLQHENVVRVVEAGRTADGLPFTVTELLDGETLAERIAREGRLHPLRALKLARDVTRGLGAAHRAGVVHRDLKPEHVFITAEGVAKVLDLATGKSPAPDLRITPPDRIAKLAFMSPELIKGGTPDARSDVYSAGLLAYTMLAGAHPFEQHFTALYELMKDQLEEIPRSLAEVAGLPPYVDELLAPALAKGVEDRYPEMDAFCAAIAATLRQLARDVQEGHVVVDIPLDKPTIDIEEAPDPPSSGEPAPAVPPFPPFLAPGQPTSVPTYMARTKAPVTGPLSQQMIADGQQRQPLWVRPPKPTAKTGSLPESPPFQTAPMPVVPEPSVDEDASGSALQAPSAQELPLPSLYILRRGTSEVRGGTTAAAVRPSSSIRVWGIAGALAVATVGVGIWLHHTPASPVERVAPSGSAPRDSGSTSAPPPDHDAAALQVPGSASALPPDAAPRASGLASALPSARGEPVKPALKYTPPPLDLPVQRKRNEPRASNRLFGTED